MYALKLYIQTYFRYHKHGICIYQMIIVVVGFKEGIFNFLNKIGKDLVTLTVYLMLAHANTDSRQNGAF